jgi:hypothetical protein
MAIKALNSIGGFSVGDTPANIILANGDITTINFTSNGVANLGNVGNVKIGGGTGGYVLSTDGAGNLSWSATGSPTNIHNGDSNVSIPLANSNVYINANSGVNQQWAFGTDGTLTFPLVNGQTTIQTQRYGMGNLAGINDGGWVLAEYNGTAYGTEGIRISPGVEGNVEVILPSDANAAGNALQLNNYVGNVRIESNGYYWNFDNAGNLTTPGEVVVVSNNQHGGTGYAGIMTMTNTTGGATNPNKYLRLNTTGNLQIVNSAYTQTIFDLADSGELTLYANLTAANANLGNLVTANFANFTNDLVVQGNIANTNNISVTNAIAAGSANITNDLVVQGNIANANNISATNNITSDTANVTGNLTAGNVDGGNLVKANNFSTNGTGGDITLTGGNVQGANVTFSNSFTSNGGVVDFSTNNANVQLGNVGNVHIGGGSSGYLLSTDGAGNLSWSATASTNNIYNGNSNVTIPVADGNVYINANSGTDQQWIFGTDGEFYLSTGGRIGTTKGGTMLDGGNGNITSLTSFYSNGFYSACFTAYADGNAQITTYPGSGSNPWVFDVNGVLTTPGNINLGGSSIVDNTSGIELYSACNYAQLNYNNASYVYVQSDGVWLEVNAGTLQLDATGNVIISQNLEVQGNIANANNISVTNAIAAGSANITNDLVVQGNIANANNISVTNNITAGSANVTNDLDVGGNIVTGTGSGGNISGVNYITANVANITNVVNTGVIANGTSNIRLATDSNVTISVNGSSNVFTFNDLGANVIGYIQANGIISAGGFEGSNLVSNVGILSLQAKQTGGDYNINLLAGGAGNIDVGSTYITNVVDPFNPQDAATKAYVDSVAQGLDVKASVQYATAAALPSYTYDNGTSGIGATITANANGALTIDGGSPAATQRVLIKDETAGNNPYNGIYVVTDAGGVGTPFILTRATDFDNGSPSGEIPGAFTFVEQGSTNADSGWVCTTNNPVTVGTTPIVFVQFSSAGSYSANTSAGLVLIGTQFNAKVDGVTTDFIGGNIAVKTSANLVTPNIGAANGTSLDLSGNLLAGNVNSNAAITAVDATFSGNITTTGAQGNISGANTIFADSFTSNGGTVDFATNNANVLLGNVGNVHVYGGSASQVLITDGAGNLSWTSTPNITIIQNGTSNVTIPTSNGNVIVDVAGNATLTVTGTGANITGTANISGNLISGNSSTSTAIITTGNITTINSGLLQNGNSNIAITSNGNITTTVAGNSTIIVTGTGANITGYANITGNLTSGNANLGNLATANTVSVTNVNVGNSIITSQTTTTLSTGANQTIATFTVTGTSVVGVEFFVKGVEAAGFKYSVAMVQAVTDGLDVDYAIYGGVRLGGTTGALAVNMTSAGGGIYEINLQATPASSNSTVWTTQIRLV